MNFIEEKTPRGYLIKIIFDKWQYLVFDRRGKSIYVDKAQKSLLHQVPVVTFVGTIFAIVNEVHKEYMMLKIRDGVIVVPYLDLRDQKTKYIFLQTDKEFDAIPVRMMLTANVSQMVREIDTGVRPNYVIVDDGVTPNDVIIIKNRYKVEEIIYSELANNQFLSERLQIPETERSVNINVLSTNPVFLARVHLRSMELSKINQLLLDFDITALDTEYILNFIQAAVESGTNDPAIEKNMPMLQDLLVSFGFYLNLLQKDEGAVRKMVDSITEKKRLTWFRTLVSKVKAMFPGAEEQKIYTVYENFLYDKLEQMKA
jgi:hypothetical protein